MIDKTRKELRGLLESLRAQRDSGRRTLGGGTISSDGKCSYWGNEIIMEARNPNGQTAASVIENLLDHIDALEAGREAVIEECAKVAETRFADIPWFARSRIAAAIRNLAKPKEGC